MNNKAKVGGRVKFELNDYKRQLTDDEIISDIAETAKRLETDYLSISSYKKYGKYSQTAIQAHFGSWKNALSITGLRTARNEVELKLISDEEYFVDLQRVANIVEQNTVSYEAYKKYGKYSAEHTFSRFGKWNTALQRAGLESTGFSKDKITEQECFDEIERMWRLLGRQPTSTDVIKNGVCRYSVYTFKRRFGGWRKALEEFVKYINAADSEYETLDSFNESSIIDSASQEKEDDNTGVVSVKCHRTSRNINTRLRFKVLQRDNFKCCACGASPAKDPSVVLHVDHIVPWSKGGETVEENLQTLCSKCNLGKSDLV